MNMPIARRTLTNLRASLVIVAFTALAAVGFATTKSIRTPAAPVATSPQAAYLPASESRGVALHTAPAACPVPAAAFGVR